MVKFCANIVRNGKMLLVSIFVDALTQRFAPLYFIALQNILPLLSSSMYKLCYLGGKIVKFLAKIVRNWKILLVFIIIDPFGLKFCLLIVHQIAYDTGYEPNRNCYF